MNECHGSSHPKCNGYSSGTYEYRICRQEKEKAKNEQYNACMAVPSCKTEYEHKKAVESYMVGTALIIGFILLIVVCFSAIQDIDL